MVGFTINSISSYHFRYILKIASQSHLCCVKMRNWLTNFNDRFSSFVCTFFEADVIFIVWNPEVFILKDSGAVETVFVEIFVCDFESLYEATSVWVCFTLLLNSFRLNIFNLLAFVDPGRFGLTTWWYSSEELQLSRSAWSDPLTVFETYSISQSGPVKFWIQAGRVQENFAKIMYNCILPTCLRIFKNLLRRLIPMF